MTVVLGGEPIKGNTMSRALILITLTLSFAAHAASAAVKKAEKAFADLEFEQATKFYQVALREGASRAERVQQYKGLGLSLAFMGDSNKARDHFVKMLMLDPNEKVDASMGAKIVKPFEAAKKLVEGKRNELVLSREPSGSLSAMLHEDVPMAPELTVYARLESENRFRQITVLAGQPLSMSFPPEQSIEVYAEARDANDGLLYAQGTEDEPLYFPSLINPAAKRPKATVAANKAVESAMSDAQARQREQGTAPASDEIEREEDSGFSKWPIIVGAVVAVGAGTAAAFYFAQPPPLRLPPADRTGQLP